MPITCKCFNMVLSGRTAMYNSFPFLFLMCVISGYIVTCNTSLAILSGFPDLLKCLESYFPLLPRMAFTPRRCFLSFYSQKSRGVGIYEADIAICQ